MTLLLELQSKGWYLSNDGFELLSENIDKPTVSSIIKKALDIDLREIGGNFLPEDLSKGKVDSISGPGVVQIQKIKNASAPKYEYGSGAPPVLRLYLTDGNNYINCLQWGPWKSITLDTPPGTKIYLKPGKITMQSNFLLLNEYQFTVLGGYVAPMVEKWELSKKLASHIRTKENLDGSGPPPWIPFGQPIIKLSKSANFRSLESEAKEAKEDVVFKQQRQANIAEVSRVKEAKSKSFGGRKEKPFATKSDNVNAPYMQSNTYVNSENDYKRTQDFNQDSPMRNRQGQNERNKKNLRNDIQIRQDKGKPQISYNAVSSQSNLKDNKLNLGDFITQDIKQRSEAALQIRSHELEASFTNSSKQHKHFNKDYRQSTDKKSQSDSQGLVNMMEQVKIFGYDTPDDKNNFAANNSFLKPNMEVFARYWEDKKFYRAIIHQVGKEGKTCVVLFPEYGNYEEVLIEDVIPDKSSTREKNWNAGPITFVPSSRSNYEQNSTHHNQNYRDTSKPHQTSNRLFGKSDYSKPSRTEYQPPQRSSSYQSRRFNS